MEFLFNRIGVFEIDKNIGNISQDELEMDLIDSGLEELHNFQDSYIITTNFEDFGSMQKRLEELNITPKSSRLGKNSIKLEKN